MLAVVGPTCSRPEDYPRAARILRGAATLLARQRPAGGVVALADLGILSLLLQIDQPEELSAFAYFSHGCSANDAASELFVHPNTVKMRIRKVESILGTDLTDTERALSIRSALLIEDVVTAREPGE
jgi:DNA-binding CsgD family transcriptional regulator